MDLFDINQSSCMPVSSRPIILIGAGGIARDAHLPAYKKAGFPVVGVYDLEHEKASALARDFQIPRVYASLEEATQAGGTEAVFDVATPASAALSILHKLP